MDMNDPENRKKALIIGLAVLVVVVYGYYNCWFGGPSPKLNLNWCPATCLAGGSSGGGSSGGGSSGGSNPTTCQQYSCENCYPPTGEDSCGMGRDYACTGYCPNGYECEYYTNGQCACAPTQQRTPTGCSWTPNSYYPPLAIAAGPTTYTCGGTCPDGSTCTTLYDTVTQATVCGCSIDRSTYVSYPMDYN